MYNDQILIDKLRKQPIEYYKELKKNRGEKEFDIRKLDKVVITDGDRYFIKDYSKTETQPIRFQVSEPDFKFQKLKKLIGKKT